MGGEHLKQPYRRLPPSEVGLDTSEARHRLPMVFGTTQLVFLGLGVLIGGGIFSLAGQQAANSAGPAVILAFVIGAVACFLAAACYAELSSALPVAGSAYTYSYVAFGERWGWLVGWALIIELVLAAGVLARLCGQYILATLASAGLEVPALVTRFGAADAPVNLLGPGIVITVMALLSAGSRLTGRVLGILVVTKIIIIVVVVDVGAREIDPGNFTPFLPESRPSSGSDSLLSLVTGLGDSTFGVYGVIVAAGAVFLSYVGFDLVSTAAEEARDARRTLPRAILLSVGIVTVIYLALAIVLVGLRPYAELGTDAPYVDALLASGVGSWVAVLIGTGASIGMLNVVTVALVALSRVLFAMGRDRLLPPVLGRSSRTVNAPSAAVLVGGSVAAFGALWPWLLDYTNLLVLAALFTYGSTALGVIALRAREPELPRGFRIPGGSLVPGLAVLAIGWLACTLPWITWLQMTVWLLLGGGVYLLYGRRHSRIGAALASDR